MAVTLTGHTGNDRDMREYVLEFGELLAVTDMRAKRSLSWSVSTIVVRHVDVRASYSEFFRRVGVLSYLSKLRELSIQYFGLLFFDA